MKKTLQCDEFCVFDEALGDEGRSELWDYFGAERFEPVPRVRFAWRLGDGQPFMGPHAAIWRDPDHPVPPHQTPLEHAALHPTGTALDRILELLRERRALLTPWVGDAWTMASATGWVYPSGSGVSWHCDSHERYTGAFIYYAHPRWHARWGRRAARCARGRAAATRPPLRLLRVQRCVDGVRPRPVRRS